jgi:hypothetical protein
MSPDPDTFLSGDNGLVVGPRLTVKRTVADAAYSAARMATLTGPRLDRLAAAQSPLRVLVVSVYRPSSRLARTIERLRSDRHDVHYAFGSTAAADPALARETVLTEMAGGKFENVNALLDAAPAVAGFDRLIVTDDDIDLGPRFLDRFLAVCERLELDLAQPAQSMRSHAAWRVTRTRPFSLARLTDFVEIGPLTAFSSRAADVLTPFPPLRFGWGLDNHWAALGREHGWRLGVVDALPVRHEWQHIASSYTHAEAKEEGARFLSGKPYVETAEAQRTLQTVRRLPR